MKANELSMVCLLNEMTDRVSALEVKQEQTQHALEESQEKLEAAAEKLALWETILKLVHNTPGGAKTWLVLCLSFHLLVVGSMDLTVRAIGFQKLSAWLYAQTKIELIAPEQK